MNAFIFVTLFHLTAARAISPQPAIICRTFLSVAKKIVQPIPVRDSVEFEFPIDLFAYPRTLRVHGIVRDLDDVRPERRNWVFFLDGRLRPAQFVNQFWIVVQDYERDLRRHVRVQPWNIERYLRLELQSDSEIERQLQKLVDDLYVEGGGVHHVFRDYLLNHFHWDQDYELAVDSTAQVQEDTRSTFARILERLPSYLNSSKTPGSLSVKIDLIANTGTREAILLIRTRSYR